LAVSILYLGLLIRPFGTVLFIAAAFIVMYLSFATRAINGAMAQIHHELEEAGRLSGASATRVILRVTVPLLKPALFFSWLWVLLLTFREVNQGAYAKLTHEYCPSRAHLESLE
jgi:iron(III) transport system permease protein